MSRILGSLEAMSRGIGVLALGLLMSSTAAGATENEVLVELRRRAELGQATAQFNLGASYYLGEGVPQDDAEAVKWFRKAAEQGHAWAQVGLGRMYYRGKGVPQHYTEALRWFRKAAEQGHAWAQLWLGVMYADGEGVPQDHVKAYAWLNIAAAQAGDEDVAKFRNLVAKRMTPDALDRAQRLSQDYWKAYVDPFQN